MTQNWTVFSDFEDNTLKSSTNDNDDDDDDRNKEPCINWDMTEEQLHYYIDQFLKVIPNNYPKLPGSIAKEYFELSRLGVEDLRNIWELSDNDKDGCLTLGEFCVAMHLVVLRKRDIHVPKTLPMELLPYFSSLCPSFLIDNEPMGNQSLLPDCDMKNSKILQRLPSDSSLKSDAFSLTESVTAFDSKPPTGLSNPKPFKPNETVPNMDIQQPFGPKELFQNVLGNDETDNTPPVPPRSSWPVKPSENSNSFILPSEEDTSYQQPLLDKNAKQMDYGIDFSLSPESIILHLNSITDCEARKEAYNYLINSLKLQCDSMSVTNEEMSKDLKQVQQQRISLEIQLEKMMPFKYN